MKGFFSANNNIAEEIGGLKTKINGVEVTFSNKSHSSALNANFQHNSALDVYVLDGYGAYISNIDSQINLLALAAGVYDHIVQYNPYGCISEMFAKGYKICVGPTFPDAQGKINNNMVGVYCSNYIEMAEKYDGIQLDTEYSV